MAKKKKSISAVSVCIALMPMVLTQRVLKER